MLILPGYRTSEKLYESSNSIVYRAQKEADGGPVIIKIMNSEFPTPEQLARFRREYELMSGLELEGVIKVYELQKYKNSLALVLEDFGGESLSRTLENRKLNLQEFLRLAVFITHTLGEIHRFHVVHKDVNPSNIVWNAQTGQVKFIDFGISTELSRENPQALSPDVLEGTLPYISPEQTGRMNRALDYRSDFYSLGATFYTMLTGVPPFPGKDPLELVHSHVAKEPPSPRKMRQDTPDPLEDIVLKLLSKTAEDRYQSSLGLELDLEVCLEQLEEGGHVDSWAIATHDVSETFRIPQKLYGREAEVQALTQAFARVGGGMKEIILVAGDAGVGKSVLVQELHKPVIEKRGFFISGKFDLFNRNVPCSALIQAFQALVLRVLTEPDQRIQEWKRKLAEALGPNARLMVDVIPELELILGPQPEAPELAPREAGNRFRLTFVNFVGTFADREHPLVLFLDDLQWSDLSSLKLLESIMADLDTRFLLIVGAFRERETEAGHPLRLTLEEIKKSGNNVSELRVKPLEEQHIGQLLADALHREPSDVPALAGLLLDKTGGNPFFLGQLLVSLYNDKLLMFDPTQERWDWDLVKINSVSVTGNVVELLSESIRKLSREGQNTLKLASCLGNSFDLKTLAMVCELGPEDTARVLWEALEAGLVFPLDDSYKFVSDWENCNPRYAFSHDRIQHAAHALIAEEQQKELHLNIGRLRLEKSSARELEEQLFSIVGQINQGRELIEEQPEKDELAGLNFKAGRKAKASGAFEQAFEFFQGGIELLGRAAWNRHYQLMLTLHENAAESAYSSGNFAAMENLVDELLNRAANILDGLKGYEVRIQAYGNQARYEEALATGLEALKKLGLSLPDKPGKLRAVLGLLRARVLLAGKQPGALSYLPPMTDPEKLATIRLLVKMGSIAYLIGSPFIPILIAKEIQLTLGYGLSLYSPFVFGAYGLLLAHFMGDLEGGYQFGRLGLSVLDKYPSRELEVKSTHVSNAFLRHIKEPFGDVAKDSLLIYQKALENGDLEYAAYGVAVYTMMIFETERSLPRLEKELARFTDVLRNLKHTSALAWNQVSHQTVLNLMGQAEDPRRLKGAAYDEGKMTPVLQKANDAIGLIRLFHNKLFMFFLLHEFEQALETASLWENRWDESPGLLIEPHFNMFIALSLLALFDDAHKPEQKRILRKTAGILKRLKEWARNAPMNFQQLYHMVEAELERARGYDLKALDAYEQAINAARDNQFIQDEAMAHELAGRFFQRRGDIFTAGGHLRQARFLFEQWGAVVKVKHMEDTYPELLSETGKGESGKGLITSSVSASGSTASQTLDINTLMKSSRAIAGEIQLEGLLERLMEIVQENAGASRGELLLEQDGRWTVKTGDDSVSEGIVNYVAHTRETVILRDGAREGQFMFDTYVRERQPRSLLCLPLLNQAELTGILYLENNLAPGAFSPERVETLQLLSSQIAVSIKNASLYEDLKSSLTRQTQLTASYERFVPQQLLQFLGKDSILDVRLGDQVQKEMSVLFTDIRGFTTLSETMTPQENFNFINSFLKRMEPLIDNHNGFIDKFIGDAIMALFPNGAESAILAAVSMLKELRKYNEHRSRRGYAPIRIGVGIHTGELMLGTVGGKNRMDGTVISDAVNLASRLEGLTKTYGVSLLVSENTIGRLKNRAEFQYRLMDQVRVKGKNELVTVMEVFNGDEDESRALKYQTRSAFERGVLLHLAGKFSGAWPCFQEVLRENPEDTAARIFKERCEQEREGGE